MFQDSGDRSLTQARFMVRSRAWITNLQMLRQGPGFEVRSSVWDSLRLAFGSTRTFLYVLGLLQSWSFLLLCGFSEAPNNMFSFWGGVGVLCMALGSSIWIDSTVGRMYVCISEN